MPVSPGSPHDRQRADPDPDGLQHEDRRKIEQPEESGMLAEPCRSILAESSRWISKYEVANTRTDHHSKIISMWVSALLGLDPIYAARYLARPDYRRKIGRQLNKVHQDHVRPVTLVEPHPLRSVPRRPHHLHIVHQR